MNENTALIAGALHDRKWHVIDFESSHDGILA